MRKKVLVKRLIELLNQRANAIQDQKRAEAPDYSRMNPDLRSACYDLQCLMVFASMRLKADELRMNSSDDFQKGFNAGVELEYQLHNYQREIRQEIYKNPY
jgi:hypothetical protein